MMATPNRRTRKRGRRACPLPSAVLALVGALVNHSLLAKDDESPNPGPARFTMLDTIRAFAHERLTASGEAEDAAARHAAWFLALAERAEPELQGPAQRAWLDRLDAEIDNLRAALAWMFARGDALAALSLTGATGMFWLKQGRYAEGRTWVARALAADDHTGRDAANRQTAVHAKALPTAGSLAFVQGDFAAAMASHEAAPRTASPVWSSRSRPPPARRPARSAAPPLQGICPGFGTGCRCCPKSGADIGCSFRNKPQQCSPNGFYCLLNNNDPGDEDCECGGELICGGGPGNTESG